MSIARHHNEWLSLLDVSGAFLSMPVLLRALPQGLDVHESSVARNVRAAHEEWEDAVALARAPDPAIHTAWLDFVFRTVLEYPATHWLSGQALPPGLELRLPEHGETLRPTHVLMAPGDALPRLLVQIWPAGQKLDKPVAGSRWQVASPQTRLMTLLQATGVPLGLATNGEQWTLVAAKPGESTTFVTWAAGLWSDEPLTLRALRTLLGARRFFGSAPGEDLASLIDASLNDQQEVTDQLGLQVRRAVEVLVRSLDRINIGMDGSLLRQMSEKQLYDAALSVMMRLVFLLCAEERRLLPVDDALYSKHYAVSTLRDQLREAADHASEQVLESRHDAWARLLATFRLVHGGCDHDGLRLPAYGGALFDPDRYAFLEGRPAGTGWRAVSAQPLLVSNRTVLHLLDALQFLQMRVPGGGVQARRLSFRALDIEQIGHVYEGLLDHTAKRATGTVLGLDGAKGSDCEIALERLEAKLSEGSVVLVDLLIDRTGRSAAALARALNNPPALTPEAARELQVACGADTALLARLRRWAPLLRTDSDGLPLVVHAGSVYVTRGSDRRSTGTHYTQRPLTERVVRATLDPLVYDGFDQGLAPTPERLRPPEQLLALKVCDLACGSGAFLVQTCRYLSEKLVEAWARADQQRPTGCPPLTIPEAVQAEGHASEQLLPADTEERLALARRLVAERCLYGVDINPMAVEMAKLSLWLVTLHKGRAFTFLDHAIKCGDSLLGLHDPAQLTHFHLRPDRPAAQGRVIDYVAEDCARLLERARQRREALEAFTVFDVRDAWQKGRLHAEAETTLASVRTLGDLIVGAALTTAGSSSALTALDASLEDLAVQVDHAWREPLMRAAEPDFAELRRLALPLLTDLGRREARLPFHWLAAFPEVFLRGGAAGGFDAVVSNPPFVGGKKITGLLGEDYRDLMVLHLAEGRRGSADLCTYFFLRAMQLVRPGGTLGLLAVNTIAEGDTRQVGLEAMLHAGHTIHAAWPNFPWPGAAAVVASEVHFWRALDDRLWRGGYQLAGFAVPTISAFLSSEDEWSPKPLKANQGKSFIGTFVLGLGFTLSEDDAQALISRNPINAEALFPSLNGEDMNSHPEQKASRWAINFWDWPLSRSAAGAWIGADDRQRKRWLQVGEVPFDYPGRVAADFPELLMIVEGKVKPERQRPNDDGTYVLREPLPTRWWHYADKRPALYHAIGRGHAFAQHPDGWIDSAEELARVLVFAQTSKTKYPVFLAPKIIFGHKLVVIKSFSDADFAILCSHLHYVWVHARGGKLKTDAVYTPSDVFDTFAFPLTHPDGLGQIGAKYHDARRGVMAARSIGLTNLYNQFHDHADHDPAMIELRALHTQLDLAVRDAYGWIDLDLGHGFHTVPYLPENDRIRYTISEPARLEVLRRLSRLNRERWQAEQDATEAARHDVEAARQTLAKPRRGARPTLTLVAPPPQPELF